MCGGPGPSRGVPSRRHRRLALGQNADIVTLPETTEATGEAVAEAMREGGRPIWVHTIAFDQISKARSTTLMISSDLGDYTVSDDAGPATGAGAVGTWPTFAPALLGSPIDHVLATANWQVQGLRVIEAEDGAGSDHRPIVAALAPTS